MSKVAFTTLGCKTNFYETDALMDLFFRNGYDIVEYDEFSDIYVVNTCTVTHVGDKKSRQMIRRAKKANPNGCVIVVGCYAQISPEEVREIEGVDIVLGTAEKADILYHLAQYQSGKTDKPYVAVSDVSKVKLFEDISETVAASAHTRAFIKIQEGCNQFCSYCIIPYARGRVRSRSSESILEEIKRLATRGFKEFVLTGIHIGSYGIDFEDKTYVLKDLMGDIHAIPGVVRIRLGSVEPRLIDDAFIEALASMPKVCDHFHLSLQSGCDAVLRRMNRKYTTQDYAKAVERLRKLYEAPSITTDVIVGFPGETDADFEETVAFVSSVAFSEMHIFPYSKREGTPAATMPDQIDATVKKQRSERLIQLAEENKEAYMRHFIGNTVSVLAEEQKDGYMIGHTTNYLKVHFTGERAFQSGMMYTVEILELNDGKMIGKAL